MLDEKAQGSLEYLLIIAGGLLVAAVVVAVLFTSSQPTTNKIDEAQTQFFNELGIENTEGSGS